MADPEIVPGEAEDEAKLWPKQQTIAKEALDFAIKFLGCGMGSDGKTPLDAKATGRLMDIIRAMSWVESKHGTGTGEQPARDPIQCGNPGDPWWKELTGQTTESSFFQRARPLKDIYAKDIPVTAEATAGFPAAAKMGVLGDKKKGHNDSKFTPTHSFTWAIPYLIHRMNKKAGTDSYNCGDVSRTRLIKGAVAYNSNPNVKYEELIVAALKLFNGLPEQSDAAPGARYSGLLGSEPEPEPQPDPAPVPPPPPPPPSPNYGDYGQPGWLQNWAPSILLALLLAMAVGVFWFHRQPLPGLAYQAKMGEAATNIVLALSLIAILMERALAVINGAWFGDETEQARGQLKAAMATNALLGNQQRLGFTDSYSLARGAEAVGDAHQSLAAVEAKKKRLRLVIGFLFGIAISAVGIRTLAGLVTVKGGFGAAFNLVDIILTGALLAGGSQGMAKVAELIRTAIDGTSARITARS